MLHNSCNTGSCGLPDMSTLSPRACGPRALGGHIRQTTRAHVTTIKCGTFTPQIKGATQLAGLHMGSDYIDIKAEMDCGNHKNAHVIRMYKLNFAIKTTQTESVLLSSPSYELKNVGLRVRTTV